MTGVRQALPPPVSRPWLLAALGVWLVVAWLGPSQPTPIQAGVFDGEVTLLRDVVHGRFGPWALGRIGQGTVLVDFDDAPGAARGDTVELAGTLDGVPGWIGATGYGSTLDVIAVERTTPSTFLPHRVGRAINERVEERLQPFDPGRALLAGFLVGETSRLAESDVEAMRRSGLSHFVAVSGSNVALFLALLAVVAGPLGWGPRRRAILGLLALPIYVAATRFEPSVLRAASMAGLALVGKLCGVVLETWQLLSLAVVILLLADPGLASNLGFQLSVAASAGVLVGSRLPARGWAHRALLVSLGAQLAVAPLLLAGFGSVPVLSPIVNLVAAPLVAVATVLGAVAVLWPGFLVGPAAWLAGLVLGLARGSAGWPQLGSLHLVLVVSMAAVVVRFRSLRPVVTLTATGLLLVALLTPGRDLPVGSVVVLDIGQGDAILLDGGEGRYALIDGGPDEMAVFDKLAAYGVDELELVVLTHVHADHAGGLIGVVGRVPVSQVWEAAAPHVTEASSLLFDELARYRVPVDVPATGARWELGVLEIVVEGPRRRYASPNDQSVVVTVHGPARTMLLAGDIERHAQADLGDLRADVLKVPHHGAATSDPGWLETVGADLAVISVGANDYGHPAPWVIDLLDDGGRVLRTDTTGDIVVDLTTP